MTNDVLKYIIKLDDAYLTDRDSPQKELWKAKIFDTEEKAKKYLNKKYGNACSRLFHIVPVEIKEVNLTKKPIYKVGDFVEFYEGMGEIGHGTILNPPKSGQLYNIQLFDYGLGKKVPYVHKITKSDMRGLSTPEKAMDYYYERNNLPNPAKNKDIET